MSGTSSGTLRGPALAAFEHEAFLYAGTADFLRGTLPFVQDGLEAGEPVLVVVGADKISELRRELGDDARRVSFADMAEVGRNPARIIPAWRDFLADHAGGPPARGVGEPVWAGRTPEEMAECQRHEALLNVAFAGGAPWRLLCPYDTASLAPEVVEAARHSHRFVTSAHGLEECLEYRGDEWPGAGDLDLPEPEGQPVELAFVVGPLEPVRRFVIHHVAGALGPHELMDLLQAVTEVAGNSLVHGGGAGTLRLWVTRTGVVCEVRDDGWITEPLVGRARPSVEREGGRGLWMANQLCDLVQLRSSPAGTVVRMHVHRRGPVAGPPAQPDSPSS